MTRSGTDHARYRGTTAGPLATPGLSRDVNGLSTPIEFTVPVPYVAGLRCVFFHEEKNEWSSQDVVTPEGQTEGEHMRCQTYHLSLFGIMLRGFLTTFVCSNLGLFTEEALLNLGNGTWFRTTAAWFFWIVVVALGTIFMLAWRLDVHRSRTCVWSDEFFLVPIGSQEGVAEMDEDEEVVLTTESCDSPPAQPSRLRYVLYLRVFQLVQGVGLMSAASRALAVVTCCATSCWQNSALKEAIDEIVSNWFEHIAELRALLEGVWEAMELSSLTAGISSTQVFQACHAATSHLVLYSSRRLAAAEMSLDVSVVAFVMDDGEFQDMLTAVHEKASKEDNLSTQTSDHWTVHNDASKAWMALLDTVSHQVRLHVCRHTWRELPRMACALYAAQNPLGSVFHYSPFMSCKMRAFFVWTEIISSIFTSTVFYSSQGGTQRRSLDALTKALDSNDSGNDPCAEAEEEEDFFFLAGRSMAVSLFSVLVATIPLLVLGSMHTRGVRRMDYKGSPEWNKQLRAWAIQDRIIWTAGTVYLSFCHLFIVLFLANIDKDSEIDWMITTVLGVIYHCILIPTALAVLMPLMATASVWCLSTVARMHRNELIRGIHENLHRKSNAMLPIMLI